MNQTCHSINGDLIEITFTVPLMLSKFVFQDLRFAVYDIDSESGFLEDHENLGTAECALAQILSADRLKVYH